MDDRTLIERLAAAVAALHDSSGNRGELDPDFARRLAILEELAAELPKLAARLDRLVELEDHFNEALEIAKLDALKELAYGASHEVNNPLANISARAQTLLQEEKDPDRRRRLAAINSQAFRAHEMIADMMLFARPPQLELKTVNLVELLDDLVRRLSEEASRQNTALVRVGGDAPVEARVDPIHLRSALRALVINSLEALAEGGRIELSVRRGPGATRGGAAEILVCDNGPGISGEIRPHLFDPFYSGREAGRGLGLGLSKCWRIVTQHGGRIDVEEKETAAGEIARRGAQFKITLPLQAES